MLLFPQPQAIIQLSSKTKNNNVTGVAIPSTEAPKMHHMLPYVDTLGNLGYGAFKELLYSEWQIPVQSCCW